MYEQVQALAGMIHFLSSTRERRNAGVAQRLDDIICPLSEQPYISLKRMFGLLE